MITIWILFKNTVVKIHLRALNEHQVNAGKCSCMQRQWGGLATFNSNIILFSRTYCKSSLSPDSFKMESEKIYRPGIHYIRIKQEISVLRENIIFVESQPIVWLGISVVLFQKSSSWSQFTDICWLLLEEEETLHSSKLFLKCCCHQIQNTGQKSQGSLTVLLCYS